MRDLGWNTLNSNLAENFIRNFFSNFQTSNNHSFTKNNRTNGWDCELPLKNLVFVKSAFESPSFYCYSNSGLFILKM